MVTSAMTSRRHPEGRDREPDIFTTLYLEEFNIAG